MTEAGPRRDHSIREVFSALRYVIRHGTAWRAMPNDLPPWAAVDQQFQRWLAAGCFETLAQSGTRVGYGGARRKRGSKVGMALGTLGHLLALQVTPADVGDRTAVKRLAADIQDATGDSIRLAYVDQGYTGEAAADAAAAEGIASHVVKLPEAKRGLVLLPDAGL